MRSREPRIVDFYRADISRRVLRVVLTGPPALTLGSLVIAVSFLTRQPSVVRVEAAAFGFILIAGGAIHSMLAMQRILRDDLCLSLRTDGVMIQSSAGDTFIAWDALTDASWDAIRQELVLRRVEGVPVVLTRPFVRISGPALAEQIASVQRRAAWNLLR